MKKNNTDELIDKVYRENQEYQKNRTTDEERENLFDSILGYLFQEGDGDPQLSEHELKKWKEGGYEGVKDFQSFVKETIDSVRKLKDELEYESMRKYEIQNRLQKKGNQDKLFRKFMDSYYSTIMMDKKMIKDTLEYMGISPSTEEIEWD